MSAPNEPTRLDTTPPFPSVEPPLLAAAARELRRVLRNLPNEPFPGTPPPDPPERLVRAEQLLDGIVAAGHERAAAAWAVHQLVQAEVLLPEVEKFELEVGTRWVPDETHELAPLYRSDWAHLDPPKRRIDGQWIDKPRWEGTGPVPYESLLLRSTPGLWTAETEKPTASIADSHAPYTLADILQLLVYLRRYPEYARQRDAYFQPIMPAGAAYDMIQFAVSFESTRGRLSEEEAPNLPLYRRLVKTARKDYAANLDEPMFRCVVAEVADAAGITFDQAMAMTLAEFGAMWDRSSGTTPSASERKAPVEQISSAHSASPPLAPNAAARPESVELPELTTRQEGLLVEMLSLEAVGSRRKVTQAEVVQRLARSDDPDNYKKDFARLRELGYTDGVAGRNGGVWLTALGKETAERLRA